MSLLLHSIGFLGPLTPSLPLFILVSLLAINPAISACWTCFTISFSHFLHIVGLRLLLGPLSKVGINIQPLEHMDCSCNSYVNACYYLFIIIFLFHRFFKQWTPPYFLSSHE